jgi:hypothetical protein
VDLAVGIFGPALLHHVRAGDVGALVGGVQRTTRDAEDPDEIAEMLDLLFLDDLPREARLGSS